MKNDEWRMRNEETTAGRLLLRLILIAALAAQPAFAVTPGSSLEGRIALWGTGEVVAGIEVTASGEDRPVTRATKTDSSGRFRFPLLPPGRYSVTAAAPGYSTVTLVGVVVHAGESRSVTIEVAVADAEESVTETVSQPVRLEGVASGWTVDAVLAAELPLRRGHIGEAAELLPGPAPIDAPRGTGTIPVDAAGVTSVLHVPTTAALDRAGDPLLVVLPRTGMDGMRGSVRLVAGERASETATERAAGAGNAQDEWLRGAVTIGGHHPSRALTGFLSLEHESDHRDDVVSGVGIDPELDGRAFDESTRRTALAASAGLEVTRAQSLFFAARGSTAAGPADASLLIAPSTVAKSETNEWTISASHVAQLSPRLAHELALTVSSDSTRTEGFGGDAPAATLVARRSHLLDIDERLGFLLAPRHELRAGVSLRSALENRLSIASTGESIVLLPDDLTSPATDLTIEAGKESYDAPWDRLGFWLEDEYSSGALRVRVGARVDRWSGVELDDVEISPRLELARAFGENGSTILRGSWGRFHDVLDPLETLADIRLARTDRASLGLARNLSGLADVSLDVVSSSVLDGEADILEVTLAARAGLFGKADAALSYTWSDSDRDVVEHVAAPFASLLRPEHRGSLTIRASLPSRFAAAAVVRHRSRLPHTSLHDDATARSSTTLDLALSRTLGSGVRAALDAFNVTNDDTSSARSVALNVLVQFGE